MTRGDIENVVSSTGQLEPVGTVEVGTQVSGEVERVLVDFNANVTRGQLLAVLDTSNLAASVRDAEAGLARAQAQYELADLAYKRADELDRKGLGIRPRNRDGPRGPGRGPGFTLDRRGVAGPGPRQPRQRLHPLAHQRQGHRPRGRAGPDRGRSFSAPTLFTIAQDLSRVRILALVDESDIGLIDSGLPAKFTVQAYPDREFEGVATQVRMLPTVSSNVVNYTVVVDAANEDEVLMPGMTATVDFYVESRKNVLLVPSTALEGDRDQGDGRRDAQVDPGAQRRLDPAVRPARGDQPVQRPGAAAETARLWYLDEAGKLKMMPVRVGATDGPQHRGDARCAANSPRARRSSPRRPATAASMPSGPPGGTFGMPRPGG